jgi:chromosome segregation ATPase
LFTPFNKYLKDYSVNTLLASCKKLSKDNETIHKINTKHNNLFSSEKTTKRVGKDVENEIKKLKQNNEKMNQEIEYFQLKIKYLENEIDALTNIKNQIQKEEEGGKKRK